MREHRPADIAAEFWDRVRSGIGQLSGRSRLVRVPDMAGQNGMMADDGLRRAFEAAWHDCAQSGATLAVVMMAIDGLDGLESRVAPKTLELVSETIAKAVSAAFGVTARPMGSGRFVLMLPALPSLMVAAKAKGAAEAVQELAIPQPMSPAGVATLGTGIAVARAAGACRPEMVSLAGEALAKAQARGCGQRALLELGALDAAA
jgi:GGDEF domain-containing protein